VTKISLISFNRRRSRFGYFSDDNREKFICYWLMALNARGHLAVIKLSASGFAAPASDEPSTIAV
jgi:hypothetical protein